MHNVSLHKDPATIWPSLTLMRMTEPPLSTLSTSLDVHSHCYWFWIFQVATTLCCVSCLLRTERCSWQPLPSLRSTVAGSRLPISLLAQCEMTKCPTQTSNDISNLSSVMWTIWGWTMILTAKTMKMSIRPLEVALLVHKMERLLKYVFTV